MLFVCVADAQQQLASFSQGSIMGATTGEVRGVATSPTFAMISPTFGVVFNGRVENRGGPDAMGMQAVNSHAHIANFELKYQGRNGLLAHETMSQAYSPAFAPVIN